MKRTTIFLTDGQIKALEKMAERKTLKMAQLIRLYISQGLERDTPRRKPKQRA
jgi:hypothetical protein